MIYLSFMEIVQKCQERNLFLVFVIIGILYMEYVITGNCTQTTLFKIIWSLDLIILFFPFSFPEYGYFKGQVLNADDLDCLYDGLKHNNINGQFSHILTGI